MMDDHVVEHDAALIPQTKPNSLRAAKKNCWAGHPQALGSWPSVNDTSLLLASAGYPDSLAD